MEVEAFWNKANRAFSPMDRAEFNRWKMELYLASERAVGETSMLPDDDQFSHVARRVRELHAMICAIPSMAL